MEQSKTPLTDKEERFFYFEMPRIGLDWNRSQRPSKNREGFVSSEFARKLEKELIELRKKINE